MTKTGTAKYLHPPSTTCLHEEYIRTSHLEYALPVRCHLPVLLDALQPPPRSVAAVEPRIGSTAQEIGNETVTQARRIGQQMITRAYIRTCTLYI